MLKKYIFIAFTILLSACSSNRKLDYVITDYSLDKKPIWIENLQKYENKKENEKEKFKYFVSESESIDLSLCKQSSIANVNRKIASEISTEIDALFTATTKVKNEEFILSNDKKDQIKNQVRSKLTGVSIKESYWEKRKYTTELGALKDKLTYNCYTLASVNRTNHEKIIQETINQQLKNIKDKELKEKLEDSIEEEAKKRDINIDL